MQYRHRSVKVKLLEVAGPLVVAAGARSPAEPFTQIVMLVDQVTTSDVGQSRSVTGCRRATGEERHRPQNKRRKSFESVAGSGQYDVAVEEGSAPRSRHRRRSPETPS